MSPINLSPPDLNNSVGGSKKNEQGRRSWLPVRVDMVFFFMDQKKRKIEH